MTQTRISIKKIVEKRKNIHNRKLKSAGISVKKIVEKRNNINNKD